MLPAAWSQSAGEIGHSCPDLAAENEVAERGHRSDAQGSTLSFY
jgi:hypothetical protein